MLIEQNLTGRVSLALTIGLTVKVSLVHLATSSNEVYCVSQTSCFSVIEVVQPVSNIINTKTLKCFTCNSLRLTRHRISLNQELVYFSG